MSLQVWLPLTGHLNNQGLSNVTVTNNGATIDNSGKIGKCYSFNGTSTKLSASNFNISNSAWSASVWVYPVAKVSGHQYIVAMNTSTAADFKFTLCCYLKKFSVRIQDTTYASNTSVSLNTWYHFTATYNGTYLKLYINGVLDSTYTPEVPASATTLTIGTRGGDAGFFTGKLNDVRIYDHVLSEKEVKELSKGLILHYPLSLGSTNLYDFESIANKWTADKVTLANYIDTNYGNVLKVTTGSSLSNYHRIYRTFPQWTSGQHYTVSFLAKASKTATCTMSRSVADFTSSFILTTEWKRYIGSIISTETKTNGTLSFQVDTTNCDIYLTQVKLEYGDIATPYTPGEGDSHYSAMGYDSSTEYDVSGYNNHGTKNGTLTYSSDSARYVVCSKFNGTDSYIEAEPLPASATTISVWLKTTWDKPPGGSGVYKLVLQDKITGLAIGFSSSGYYMVSYTGTGSGGTGSNVNTADLYQANKWNHIVVIKTGSTTRTVYINGQLAPADTKSYWGCDIDKLFIGCRHQGGDYKNYFDGQISDLRIYATALTADDVKELYNTAASLANNGTLFAYDFVEV